MCYGPEFVAKAVQTWITAVGAKTAYIERGSPWENGDVESFNARLRDELLDGEIFAALQEAKVVIESRRRHDNSVRPHASLGYRPPAPEVFGPAPCLVGLPTTGSGGVRSGLRGLAGCAIPTGSAGQDLHSAKTNPQLTFTSDHPMGADHRQARCCCSPSSRAMALARHPPDGGHALGGAWGAAACDRGCS